MVFSGLECMGELPFRHVFIHGLVRDESGRKMSKSLANGVDPLEVMDEYGADALRYSLLSGSAAGGDMRFIPKNVEAARNFANKLWNAARFVIMNLDDAQDLIDIPKCVPELRDEDRWMLSRVESISAELTGNLERFEISVAMQKLHDLIRDDYCDWYIELVKARLYGEDVRGKAICQSVLTHVLRDLLRLLHPFMPFITEEIWSYLGRPNRLICDCWPTPAGFAERFAESAARIELVKDVVRAVRGIRADAGAAPSRGLPVIIKPDAQADEIPDTETLAAHVKNLANVSSLSIASESLEIPEDTVSAILPGMTLHIPADDLIDYAAERERLEKERTRLDGEIKRLSSKLANEGFTAKAPGEVVNSEREKLFAARAAFEKTLARIEIVKDK
jgi:valyl-tRNA synthetase